MPIDGIQHPKLFMIVKFYRNRVVRFSNNNNSVIIINYIILSKSCIIFMPSQSHNDECQHGVVKNRVVICHVWHYLHQYEYNAHASAKKMFAFKCIFFQRAPSPKQAPL